MQVELVEVKEEDTSVWGFLNYMVVGAPEEPLEPLESSPAQPKVEAPGKSKVEPVSTPSPVSMQPPPVAPVPATVPSAPAPTVAAPAAMEPSSPTLSSGVAAPSFGSMFTDTAFLRSLAGQEESSEEEPDPVTPPQETIDPQPSSPQLVDSPNPEHVWRIFSDAFKPVKLEAPPGRRQSVDLGIVFPELECSPAGHSESLSTQEPATLTVPSAEATAVIPKLFIGPPVCDLCRQPRSLMRETFSESRNRVRSI